MYFVCTVCCTSRRPFGSPSPALPLSLPPSLTLPTTSTFFSFFTISTLHLSCSLPLHPYSPTPPRSLPATTASSAHRLRQNLFSPFYRESDPIGLIDASTVGGGVNRKTSTDGSPARRLPQQTSTEQRRRLASSPPPFYYPSAPSARLPSPPLQAVDPLSCR